MTRLPDHRAFTQASELAEILTPFVDAKRNLSRNAQDYVIPRSIFVDITEPGIRHRDASVREVNADGVVLVSADGSDRIELTWSRISKVVIRGADGSQVVAWAAANAPVLGMAA